MDSLFGVPTQSLTLVLLSVFTMGALALAFMAARDRTSFRMAVRNIPRRRAQAGLIVAGLMLATVLFSAAFTTGDTLTNSLRVQALEDIGRVDVVVKAKRPDSGEGVPFGPGAGVVQAPQTREKYFDAELADEVRNRLSGKGDVSGIAPIAKESVPVTAPKSDLSEPSVDVLGMDASSMKGFDKLTTTSGRTLSVDDLDEDAVYLSREAAEGLGVSVGDRVEASLSRPVTGPARATPPEPRSGRRDGATQGAPGGPETGDPRAKFGGGGRPPPPDLSSRPAPRGPRGSRGPRC